MYAANDPHVVNASVEFDEKTLQPTYKLLLGLAGASSGIEIARRFGIKQEVIDHARQNLDISAQDAEAYLRKLQTETKLAEDLRIALEEEREATAMKYAGLEIEAISQGERPPKAVRTRARPDDRQLRPPVQGIHRIDRRQGTKEQARQRTLRPQSRAQSCSCH
jgi:DNA mismatch repair protein MutS2